MKLHIEMFGEFTIYVDGEKNFQYEGRTRKLWNLLQYLLVNRNRPVPQAELFPSHIWMEKKENRKIL